MRIRGVIAAAFVSAALLGGCGSDTPARKAGAGYNPEKAGDYYQRHGLKITDCPAYDKGGRTGTYKTVASCTF